MSIKLGATVRQIVPAPVVGVVVKKQFVEATDKFQYLVESPDSDGDGVPQTRWFEDGQIEQVEAYPAKDLQVITAGDVGNVADVLGEPA